MIAGSEKLSVHPLDRNRWKDLEQLFGPRGACGGCWCMYWRLPHRQWARQKGGGNQQALWALVQQGVPLGLLAYSQGVPVGWCAVAPRTDYPRLAASRVLHPVDDQPVWSITCFFVARPYRRRGVSLALLEAAADYARQHGARLLEGYPTDASAAQPDAFVYTGLTTAFRQAGFREVARRSAKRPIMRREIGGAGL